MHEKTECKQCHKVLEKMDLFPNDLCIECYEKTPEAKEDYAPSAFIEAINI